MADDVLKIGAEFDVGPIVAGVSATVKSFDQAGVAAGNLAKENANLEASHHKAAAAANQHRNETQKLDYSMREARGAARLFAEEIGLHLNRELASAAAHSSLLGPLLSKVFVVGAIIGVIELLKQVPGIITNITSAIAGWSEEAQKAYREMVDGNIRLMSSNADLADQIRRLNLVGAEGVKKYTLEKQDAAAAEKAHALLLADHLRGLIRVNEEIETYHTFLGKILRATHLTFGSTKLAYEGLIEDQKKLNAAIDEQAKKVKELHDVEVPRMALEEAHARRMAGLEDQTARVEHYAKYISDVEAYDQEVFRNRLKLQEITATQETAMQIASLTRQIDNETDAFYKRRALKLAEGATGQDVTKAIEAMDADHEAKRMEFAKKVLGLQTTLEVQLRKEALNTADAVINANEKMAQAELKRQESQQKFVFSKAESPAELEEAVIPYLKTTTELSEAQARAIEARAAALKNQPGIRTAEELDKLKAMESEATALRTQGAAAAEAVERDKYEKLKKFNQDELDNTIQTLQAGVRAARERYDEEAGVLRTRLEDKKISLRGYLAEVKSLDAQEYAESSG